MAFDIRLYCHSTSLDRSNYPYTHLSVSHQLPYKTIKGYEKYFEEKVATKIFARVIALSAKLKNRALHMMHTRYNTLVVLVLARVHNIYMERECPTPVCPVQTHCVK